MLVARGYNFACIKKRSNCITVPTLLSMIVALQIAPRPTRISVHKLHDIAVFLVEW